MVRTCFRDWSYFLFYTLILEMSPFGALRSILALKGYVARNEYQHNEKARAALKYYILENQHGETRSTRQTKDESATTKRESNTHTRQTTELT